MKTVRASGMLGLVALALIASPVAQAQDSGLYIGANIGQSKAKIDDVRITSGLLGAGFATTSISDRYSDTGFKVFGGYSFNKYFAFEAGYFELGKFGFTAMTSPAGSLIGDIKLKGFNLDAVLNIPMGDWFSVFVRAGAANAEAKDSFAGTGSVYVLNPSPSTRETNLKFGAGLQFDFSRSFGMRVEAERFRINDAVGNKGDVDLISAGILIRFGREAKQAAAPPPVPVVEPVPYRPAPVIEPLPPVLVIVPVAEKTEKYCTILDIQFEIDKDDIQREEKERLAVIGTFMEKYPEITAVIEGHTDNVGTSEHNLLLSKRRAESVVAYLVETLHIAPRRLMAVGYGESRPLADNATEDGKRLNRRINAVIACATDIAGLKVAPARMTMAMLIEFDRNEAVIQPHYRAEMQKVADFLKANPSVTATVEGHTGNVTPDRAVEISQRRAEHVVKYLVENFGISPTRLTAEGFGKSRRFAYNTSAEGQQENRRVNIIINYPK